MTVTVALAEVVPAEPVQLIEYVVVTLGETAADPEVAFPVEKFVPEQELAFVEDHVSVDDCLFEIEVGFAVKLAVGVPWYSALISLADSTRLYTRTSSSVPPNGFLLSKVPPNVSGWLESSDIVPEQSCEFLVIGAPLR
jgi:hypothetical protein